MDIKSSEERSRNMSAIRGKDTKPEVYFRKQLFSRGYRYRKNVDYIPGHPDIYLARYNTAVFVHGCFWHRHQGCKYSYTPKSRIDFWQIKFEKNRERDIEVQRLLCEQGVKCLIVWECTVKKMMRDVNVKNEILKHIDEILLSSELYFEI